MEIKRGNGTRGYLENVCLDYSRVISGIKCKNMFLICRDVMKIRRPKSRV